VTAGPDPEDVPSAEHRDLGSRVRRVDSPRLLSELMRPAEASVLVLNGRSLTEVSAYGGVVLRAGMEVHLGRDPSNRLVLIEPAHSGCFDHLSDLVGSPVGQRWSWAGTRSPSAARGTDVLVPATVIRDREDRTLIAELAIPAAASALRYDIRVRRLLQEASVVFLDNVEQHARSHAVEPVIAAAYHPGSQELQLVCINVEEPGALPVADEAGLRAVLADTGGGQTGIGGLTARSRGGLGFAVRMMAGTGRGRRTSDRSWDWNDVNDSLSGFIAGLELHV
jgi:hypothetical protein